MHMAAFFSPAAALGVMGSAACATEAAPIRAVAITGRNLENVSFIGFFGRVFR
ncbi:hypothetical protein GCM10007918_24200 [Piscinibacter gummiphilus]|nr:hypothetical protein GCM10007918_24200 [Piscinibacter gummiphilus]